jgi:hypothetical protein
MPEKDTKLLPKKRKVPENAGLDSNIVKSGAAPKNTGQFGKGNPGKPKGALSKTTKTAKEAIAAAADALGGSDRLVSWVREDPANERVFWGTIYPKLLPLQVSSDSDSPLEVRVIQRVIVDPAK